MRTPDSIDLAAVPDMGDVTEAVTHSNDAAADSPAREASGLIDPGWLFLVAGLALIGATVLIPAADDLQHAQYLRDSALRVQEHREKRLEAYQGFHEAVKSQDRSLVMSLAASQLNQIPADRAPIPGMGDGTPRALTNASVFPALEPPPLKLHERVQVDSTLKRLATGETTRLWLIAAGAACVLIGVLPKARAR